MKPTTKPQFPFRDHRNNLNASFFKVRQKETMSKNSKNPPPGCKPSSIRPPIVLKKPRSSIDADHNPRYCHNQPCRCSYPTKKLHRIRESELHRYPVVRTDRNIELRVDENGLVCKPRKYPISEPPTELEIEIAMTWFADVVQFQIEGKQQTWYGVQEVRFYLKQVHKYASSGAVAVGCHRLGIPIRDEDQIPNFAVKLPSAWFKSIKARVAKPRATK